MDNQKHYFRDKRLTRRQKWHQKILRPLASFIVRDNPAEYLINGVLFAAFWIVIRVAVMNFYGLISALPWIVMAIALVLAGLSHVLRKGDGTRH